MYALSRSLYRELSPLLTSAAGTRRNGSERQDLLTACEETMRRLVLEPDTCADPALSLFRRIRHMFPLRAQRQALGIVQLHVDACRLLGDRFEASLKRECRALTRKGTPCRREAREGRLYCPSHRHLEEAIVLPDAGRLEGEIRAA
jgi:hypothetical protein